ncbi:MAG: HAMP domain-containing protein [Ardenticatenaceae bacterium]|nr:HAMP domain-containing protein [Ardenticatenaceae bacterium]
MSIQNRLLFIYTIIFSIAFLLIALIVYNLPRNRILAEIDGDLEALADEVIRPGNLAFGRLGTISISLPDDLANFETASTLLIIVDARGTIIANSQNLGNFEGTLDPNGFGNEKNISQVRQEDALLRVLTVPIKDGSRIVGYLQVGRLLDNYESFNRILFIALLVGLGAASASLFVAVWLTPSLFRPLEDIASVAGQITRADDLSRRVPGAERSDEIGDLARSFNQTLERLERLFRSQQRLLADVSHELRTPLTAMRGNVDLMRRMGEVDWASLDIIHDEIQRMTRLVSDLLLLARADSGGMSLQLQVIELDNLFFDVYRQAQLLPKSVDLVVTAVDQIRVYGDPDRLKQLLLNLIDNAIKYTPTGGHVYLALSKENGWANIQITDTGIGIPPEDLPHIFDRFYRVDKARTRQQGGSGLGLSIAKSIAQAHHGDIKVRSEVGKGTTFIILLPILEDHSTPEIEESAHKTRPGLRLLIPRQPVEN